MLLFYLSILETDEERQTFSNIYARVKYKCLAVAMKITKDKTLAEDAVHDAFLKVIKNKEKIFALPCQKQDSYIVITTKNKAIDMVRSIKPTDDILNEYGEEIIIGDNDVADVFENSAAFDRLKELVVSLPNIYRVVFEMKYLQDLSTNEIADALDITPDTVATRMTRARRKMMEIIEREYKEYGD